jgi:23S rRNA (adenine2503-C2)-methyltransferase
MTELPATLRARLNNDLDIYGLCEHSRIRSKDGLTTKLLLKTVDSQLIETVSIREPSLKDKNRTHSKRHTVCISSQIGCAMGCVFCASGLNGILRNLTVGEILDQVILVQQRFGAVSNMVFMGMGEPLTNFSALSKALKLLCAPESFGFGARRITVSTVGIVSNIQRLGLVGLPVGLAVSLHAANNELRRKLVPSADRWSVSDIVSAAEGYARATGRTITFEYVLLAGINDSTTHALTLARLLLNRRRFSAKVNVIPYNPVPGIDKLLPPSQKSIDAFVSVLRKLSVPVTIRKEKGQEVSAACGQLRRYAQLDTT